MLSKDERNQIWSDTKIWIGGIVMKEFFTKMWAWIKGQGKESLKGLVIVAIKSQQDELETIIRDNAEPKKLAEQIINWIIIKIEKI